MVDSGFTLNRIRTYKATPLAKVFVFYCMIMKNRYRRIWRGKFLPSTKTLILACCTLPSTAGEMATIKIDAYVEAPQKLSAMSISVTLVRSFLSVTLV